MDTQMYSTRRYRTPNLWSGLVHLEAGTHPDGSPILAAPVRGHGGVVALVRPLWPPTPKGGRPSFGETRGLLKQIK